MGERKRTLSSVLMNKDTKHKLLSCQETKSQRDNIFIFLFDKNKLEISIYEYSDSLKQSTREVQENIKIEINVNIKVTRGTQ